jgi:ABC-type phosphate/phosphonate transport system ATPase subunit
MLEKEFEFYVKHQDELVKKYNGRVIVIKDQKVIGVFDSELDAVNETSKTHEVGTFLVHRCEPGEQNYSMTFHSRVLFAQ